MREAAEKARSWPFEEARKLVARIGGKTPDKGYVLFETGYGPSGLPHIGTFGEVVRTTMVRRAFEALCDVPTRLFAFSDDMDGLRKVPDNVPNQEMLSQHLGKPLTSIPDPFGTHDSFGEHNNARLRAFLDQFGFQYEFQSSTDCYRSGQFDPTLLAVLRNYDAVMGVMLPTLRPERRATYSPFLPVCARTGQVLQVPMVARDVEAGTVTYRDEESGELVTVPVTGGRCKLQWKVDWAMRWTALGVDYEMSGKDLMDSVKLSGQICRILGGKPPEGFTYELFLDDKGEKISKSKGNGLSVEEWLRYAPQESLQLYMFNAPRKAKRLYFDVIPKHVDDYLAFLEKYPAQEGEAKLDNAAWHIHGENAPQAEGHVSFGLLLNLAGAANTGDRNVLWGFISRYAPEATPEKAPLLDRMVEHALHYFRDFVKPGLAFRAPTGQERAALEDLVTVLEGMPDDASAEDFQNQVFEVGKRHEFTELRQWFKALYEVLLGRDQGPRMGSFIALYGRSETIALIQRALAGQLG